MKGHLGFIGISFVLFTLFSVGLYNFLTNVEPNRCNMTFMYEYPQLIKVPLPLDINKAYGKYGLYAYGEGRIVNKIRAMKFSGIPILFIPGNRGSPKQVRSLASVSLTKSARSRSNFVFDYFAVDLNEDFSGLYGGFLREQTTFVNLCLKEILSFYKSSSRPTPSVVLIAHSMGGMIAKGLFLEPDFDPESIQMIITLATPHSPALLSDNLVASYYDYVNGFWDNYNASENNINLISVGGGPRDVLVRSELTLTPHADLSVLTPAIPNVWMPVDHLCVLWCKELVLSIVRALFDSVDLSTKQITKDMNLRKEIFNYHLLNKSGGKSYHSSTYRGTIDLVTETSSGSWTEMNGTSYSWTKPEGETNPPTYVIISLAVQSDTLALEALNHETRDWIFACSSHTIHNGVKKCKTGINLSSQGRIAATMDIKRKTALINLSYLRRDRYTHLVVRTLPSKEFVQLNVDLFKKRERVLTGSSYYFISSIVTPQTTNDSMFYSVELPDISKFWHLYEVVVVPNSCSLDSFGVATVRIPWSNEGATRFLKGTSDSVQVSLVMPKQGKDGNVAVDLFLNPQCSYAISVERSLVLALGAVVGRFGPVLLAHITVCLLLSLAYQIKTLGETSNCPLLHFIMPVAAKPYFIIQATALVGTLVQHLANFLPFLPETDVKNHAGFVEVVVIPVFLHLTAFSITYALATGALITVVLQGQAFNGLFLRFVNKFFFGLTWLSEYVVNGMSKVPIAVSAFMITVASSACGGLALSIGLFFYFFKLISLYEDFWEEIVYWPLKILKWKLKQRRGQPQTEMPRFQIPPIRDIGFHLSLLLLWSISALITVPSVLVWAKNYKYSTHLFPDPTFYNAVIMSACAGVLWQSETPKVALPWSKQVGYIIVGASILIMVYAQTSIYRISHILSGVFVLVTVHQLFASFFSSDDEPDQLVPIPDDDLSMQIEFDDDVSIESNPPELDDKDDGVNQQEEVSDADSNELDEEKSKTENGNEKDILSEGSSTSSFEHIFEQEQL